MTVSNIYKLLDKLEMKILKGTPIPLTPWVIVNHECIIDILDKIRASIPGEIQEAHSILKKSDEMQAEAQRVANQIVMDAKRQSESMLSESELLRAVQAEADRIRQQVISDCELLKKQTVDDAEMTRTTAINEAISIREGSDKYAENVLANLERDLSELHEVVKNGQKHLAKVKAESLAALAAQRSRTNSSAPSPNVQD